MEQEDTDVSFLDRLYYIHLDSIDSNKAEGLAQCENSAGTCLAYLQRGRIRIC